MEEESRTLSGERCVIMTGLVVPYTSNPMFRGSRYFCWTHVAVGGVVIGVSTAQSGDKETQRQN